MRTTPNDPSWCLHEDLHTEVNELRMDGRLVRLDATVTCWDCEQVLDRTSHNPKGPR